MPRPPLNRAPEWIGDSPLKQSDRLSGGGKFCGLIPDLGVKFSVMILGHRSLRGRCEDLRMMPLGEGGSSMLQSWSAFGRSHEFCRTHHRRGQGEVLGSHITDQERIRSELPQPQRRGLADRRNEAAVR